MKIKTCELNGKALDFAVALIEGATYSRDFDEPVIEWTEKFDTPLRFYSPSTNWAQGGQIIEREQIALWPNGTQPWDASVQSGKFVESGQTPLEAAMRCHVSSKLGPEVNIPGELL